ncbi:MAG: ABC transporter permease [Gulosibacter sp.]|uniref:ABC transporter permease n=1 Tax=Gulosibacter sp. TaxID=2817531 RepID=UPI003F93F366
MTEQPKPTTLARAVSRVEGIRLIAQREILTTVRSKAFIWSFIITLAVIALVILGQGFIGNVMSSMFEGDEEDTVVASTVDVAALDEAAAESNILFEPAASADEALEAVRSGDAEAALVTGAEATSLELYSNDGSALDTAGLAEQPYMLVGNESVPTALVDFLTITPAQGFLEAEGAVEFWLTFLMSTAFALLYFMSIMMFSQRIAQTVIEEKASRIVELLLSSVKPVTVLGGKIIGGTIMAFAQVAAIVIVALVCFAITGQSDMLSLLGPAMIWFAVLFLVGFVLFAALYAALASTVSRPEDVASATSPLSMLVMVPYFLVIFANQNDAVMTWLSYIPFSAPVAMPVRLFNSGAEWWEPFVALVILVVTVVVALWIAARIYENSILRTGAKVKLKDALKAS